VRLRFWLGMWQWFWFGLWFGFRFGLRLWFGFRLGLWFRFRLGLWQRLRLRQRLLGGSTSRLAGETRAVTQPDAGSRGSFVEGGGRRRHGPQQEHGEEKAAGRGEATRRHCCAAACSRKLARCLLALCCFQFPSLWSPRLLSTDQVVVSADG